MFIKIGDASSIIVIKPIDVDAESTAKSLKKAIKSVKDKVSHEAKDCQIVSEKK